MKYQPEVDGLRAIAVSVVVLFHAGIAGVGGGFVGVDVFFVISGYLISKIIMDGIDQKRFSVADFYNRRIRRIMPALFAVLAVTTAVAVLLLTPANLEEYGSTVAAVALSASNVWFWRTTDYFGLGASWIPLLHTWSLAVEEQFYFVFPIYLILARRFTRLSWATLILVPLTASFVLSVFLVRSHPEAAFFLPFGRVWELLIGSALAANLPRKLPSQPINNALATGGLLLIGFAVFSYSESGTLFPGESAVIPCLGAALIIYSSRPCSTWVQRLLSAPPVVWVGKISYSLYLWHWPLLVFARIIKGQQLSTIEGLSVAAASVVMGYLSWKFVEQPFRRPDSSVRRAFAGAGVGLFACMLFGLAVRSLDGLPNRFPTPAQLLASGATDVNSRRGECDGPSVQRIQANEFCIIGADVPPTFALVGDSFADAVMPGIEVAAREAGVSVIVLSKAGCRPIIQRPEAPVPCDEYALAVADKIQSMPEITSVLMVGRWSTMVEGQRFGAIPEAPRFMSDGKGVTVSAEANKQIFAEGLARMVRAMGDKAVNLVAFLPEQDVLVPQTALIRSIFGMDMPTGISREVFERRQAGTRAALGKLAIPSVRIFDASDYFCDRDFCPVVDGHTPLYFDDNHPTATQAVRIKDLFLEAFSLRS